MQYHWVVCYDQETGTFDIDWDMTYQALDGVIFDPASAWSDRAWSMPDESPETDKIYDTLSIHLDNALDKHYTL